MANQDPIFLAIKWSLLIINVISAVYICIIFLEYLFNNHRHGFSVPFMFNCVVGFLISFLGAYAGESSCQRDQRIVFCRLTDMRLNGFAVLLFPTAYHEQYNLLIIYGIVLIINIVIASFGGDFVYRANLGLYVVCIVLAFLFAYILHRGGTISGSNV